MWELEIWSHGLFYLHQESPIFFPQQCQDAHSKILIVKGNMTNDTAPIGNNAKLEEIAKISINIQLFDLRIRRSMRGMEA